MGDFFEVIAADCDADEFLAAEPDLLAGVGEGGLGEGLGDSAGVGEGVEGEWRLRRGGGDANREIGVPGEGRGQGAGDGDFVDAVLGERDAMPS